MDSLFAPLFPPATLADWQAQVQKELKEEGAHERLRWQTDEGFTLEPYYTAASLQTLPLAEIQCCQKAVPGWLNAPEYIVTDEKTTNTQLRDALTRGVTSLIINTNDGTNLARLLHGIKLSDTPVFFRLGAESDAAAFLKQLREVAPYQLKGGLLNSGGSAEAVQLTADSPQFRTICGNGTAFHNAGATASQELAFTLASLADTYDQLTNDGLTSAQLIPKTMVSLAVGESYFIELAKLRAFRVLFQRFASAYAPEPVAHLVFVHAHTSTFYDSVATPYTNLLRGTTEAMSAVIGGCDALTVHPYDAIFAPSTEFSERVARNVSLLLSEEGFLDKVADPSAGSYYIEQVTHQLVEKAWALFMEVEKQGGLAEARENGFVQTELDRAYQTKVDAVRAGKTIVGVTRFHTAGETAISAITPPDSEFGLPNRRLAADFETLPA